MSESSVTFPSSPPTITESDLAAWTCEYHTPHQFRRLLRKIRHQYAVPRLVSPTREAAQYMAPVCRAELRIPTLIQQNCFLQIPSDNVSIRKSPLEAEEELTRHQYKEKLEDIRAHIEKKNKFKNLSRCLSEDQRAQNKNSAINEAKELRHVQQYEYEKEEQLSRELNEINRQQIVEKRMRQHLRENCHELKELEAKLRAAYINKELVAQLAEKEAKQIQDKIRDKEINKLLTEATYNDEQYRTFEVQEDINRKAKYKQELQDQMIYKEKSHRFAYDEFLQEKKTLDDIAERMFDEDERAREEKMCKKKKFQEEIEAFRAAQTFWKEKHKDDIAEENRKIQEYVLSKASDVKARKEEEQRKEAAKNKIFDQIAMDLYETKRKREEREEIILQLLDEERKEEMEKRHRNEIENEVRRREETLRSLEKQIEEQKEKMRKQADEDALYKEQLIAKIAEDERVEQLSNEKKRLKMVSVRKMVEEQMAIRRQTKAEEMQRQMKLLELEQQEIENRNHLIQQERIRILQEHGHNLIGFMPKGAIDPDDVQHLGSDVIHKWCQN